MHEMVEMGVDGCGWDGAGCQVSWNNMHHRTCGRRDESDEMEWKEMGMGWMRCEVDVV